MAHSLASNEGIVSCDARLEVEGKDSHRETAHSNCGTYKCPTGWAQCHVKITLHLIASRCHNGASEVQL